MGDIADFMIDSMIDRNLNFTGIPIEPDYSVWHMKNGKSIKVKDMTVEHINNTIAMLQRGNYIYKDGYIKSMKTELSRRAKLQEGAVKE